MLPLGLGIVIGDSVDGQRGAWCFHLDVGGTPVRSQGGAQETSGRVQPLSLLHESVTRGDLHRPEPCFMSPDEDSAMRHPRPLLGSTETRRRPRGKGDAGRVLGDRRPSTGGKGSPAPSPVRELPPYNVLLHAAWGRPWPQAPPCCSQGPSCSCGWPTALRGLAAAAPWFTCDPWLAQACPLWC